MEADRSGQPDPDANKHDVPELLSVVPPHLLTGVAQPEEEPGGEVDEDAGDDGEAVPHRGQHGPHVLTI